MTKKLLQSLAVVCLLAGLGQAQNGTNGTLTAQGADCTTVGACVLLKFDQSGAVGGASIALSGSFTATVQFEASNDGLPLTSTSKVWVAINGTPANGTTPVTSATTANTWQFNVAGYTDIRARASAWTSAPTVVIRSSTTSAKSGGGTSLPALSDNGTVVTSTEPIVLPSGAKSATALQFAADGATTGFYRNAGGSYGLSISNNAYYLFGSASFLIGNAVPVLFSSGDTTTVTGDAGIRRRGAANLQLGFAGDVNGTPVDQFISVQNAITGSDLPGGHFTIDAPLGTGLGAASKISINRAIMKATGATAQTAQNAFAVGQSKTLSNTSATAQTIATITLGSNAGGGAGGTFTLVCTDGTNFDSETQAFTVSFVNKAAAVTVGTPAITTSTAANNSGSCTLGITAVANGNNIDLKVTPVFTTIVPTTVTLYPIITHSTNTVTFN